MWSSKNLRSLIETIFLSVITQYTCHYQPERQNSTYNLKMHPFTVKLWVPLEKENKTNHSKVENATNQSYTSCFNIRYIYIY